jgi:hypothetical protein
LQFVRFLRWFIAENSLLKILIFILQAQPLFKDRKKFTLMADPLLRGEYPVKGLYQALAVAAMCIQEEADTRPLIGDVVTALEYLVMPRNNEKGATDPSQNRGGHVELVTGECGTRETEIRCSIEVTEVLET